MKYAREVIDLMAAYPHRQWKMAELVRAALNGRPSSRIERDRARQGVLRVMKALEDAGKLTRIPTAANGALYQWGKVRHEVFAMSPKVLQEVRQ